MKQGTTVTAQQIMYTRTSAVGRSVYYLSLRRQLYAARILAVQFAVVGAVRHRTYLVKGENYFFLGRRRAHPSSAKSGSSPFNLMLSLCWKN